MRRTILTVLLVMITIGSSMACSTPLTRGIRDYEAGVHPRAMDHLREIEEDMLYESGHDRVRYALYRGLTHMALGDMESAERWLADAKSWVDRDPSLLDAGERGRLETAWVSIGHQPGTWGSEVYWSR